MFSALAFAQVDASTSLLLRSNEGTTKTNPVPNLDSSRYTIKPNTSVRVIKSAPEKPAEEIKTVQKPAAETAVVDKPVVNKQVVDKPTAPPTTAPEEEVQSTAPDAPIEQFHPQDSRLNLVNLSASAGYLYQDSSSQSWFRDYSSSGPGIRLEADIWFSQKVGINIDYFTTLSADIRSEPTTDKRAIVDHRNLSAGFTFRRFSSFSRKSPVVVWGINYTEYQMIVPKTEANRTRLKSTGPSINLELIMPKTFNEAWFIGAELFPKIKVEEEKTSVQVKSGKDLSAYGFTVSFGQRYSIDREGQVFWRLSHRLDKSVYNGVASPDDPITGVPKEGVAVTTGTSLFEIGYTWGD